MQNDEVIFKQPQPQGSKIMPVLPATTAKPKIDSKK
jgi:hypothetical protein